MKLNIYDSVKLTEDIESLKATGIEKNCTGDLIELYEDSALVLFLNDLDYGDYAFAVVNLNQLEYVGNNDDIKDELAAAIKKMNRNKTSFNPCDVKEYDKVELIVEKPKYAIEGVHKGMTGCVMSAYAIQGKWNIIFTENGTGKDIADICVAREDFKIIE